MDIDIDIYIYGGKKEKSSRGEWKGRLRTVLLGEEWLLDLTHHCHLWAFTRRKFSDPTPGSAALNSLELGLGNLFRSIPGNSSTYWSQTKEMFQGYHENTLWQILLFILKLLNLWKLNIFLEFRKQCVVLSSGVLGSEFQNKCRDPKWPVEEYHGWERPCSESRCI